MSEDDEFRRALAEELAGLGPSDDVDAMVGRLMSRYGLSRDEVVSAITESAELLRLQRAQVDAFTRHRAECLGALHSWGLVRFDPARDDWVRTGRVPEPGEPAAVLLDVLVKEGVVEHDRQPWTPDEPGPPYVRSLCQWPSVSPHRRPSVLPTGGHVFSPLVATKLPTGQGLVAAGGHEAPQQRRVAFRAGA